MAAEESTCGASKALCCTSLLRASKERGLSSWLAASEAYSGTCICLITKYGVGFVESKKSSSCGVLLLLSEATSKALAGVVLTES